MLHDLDYQLIVSSRAKRASLRVVPGRGLVVSIPKNFPKNQVAGLIARHRDWIRDSFQQIEASTPQQYRQWPPRDLPLAALGITMRLHFCDTCILPADTNLLLHRRILSSVDDKLGVVNEIKKHLKTLAGRCLPAWLAAHAHLQGLHYQRVSIRGQRTVWGSYSSSGTLSLNYKLLFLSRELVDYVLLHELAHTVHQNHSAAFWGLLCQLNAHARVLDGRLRSAGLQVPPWLERVR